MKYKREVCIENFDQARIAWEKGADQLELCSRLDLDGLTPSFKDIYLCLKELPIHVKIMIRPKGGDFESTPNLFQTMQDEILAIKDLGAQEVVLGLTLNKSRLDLIAIRKLALIAAPMQVTVHKAIDGCQDILSETKHLCQLPNITSVLTSGGHLTALEGASVIRQMIDLANGRITIIPAGKITNRNIEEIHNLIGAKIYHGRNIVGPL